MDSSKNTGRPHEQPPETLITPKGNKVFEDIKYTPLFPCIDASQYSSDLLQDDLNVPPTSPHEQPPETLSPKGYKDFEGIKYTPLMFSRIDASRNSSDLLQEYLAHVPPTSPFFPCIQRWRRKRKITSDHDDRDSSSIKVKKRCKICSKKVGLTGFRCKCGQIFCGAHRHPEAHKCGFDFKTAGRLSLIKENPVCKGEKLKDRI